LSRVIVDCTVELVELVVFVELLGTVVVVVFEGLVLLDTVELPGYHVEFVGMYEVELPVYDVVFVELLGTVVVVVFEGLVLLDTVELPGYQVEFDGLYEVELPGYTVELFG
jgi:hypothetical protein